MAWKATIAGVDRTDKIEMKYKVRIRQPHNERATATFTCVPGFDPPMRSEVILYHQDGVTPLFGGIIFNRRAIGLHSLTYIEVQCVDWWVYATWRYHTGGYVGPKIDVVSSSVANPSVITTAIAHGLVTGETVFFENHPSTPPLSNTSQVVTVLNATQFTVPVNVTAGGAGGTMQRTTVVTLKRVLQDIILYDLGAFGITLDPAQVDGPGGSGPGLTWVDKTVVEIIRDLTTYSGGYMPKITPGKVLSMSLPNLGVPNAPFSITDTNKNARELTWTESSEKYATRIKLRCGGSGTRALQQSWTVDAALIAQGYAETDVPSTPTGGVSVTVNGTPRTIGAAGSGSELTWDWQTHRITPGTLVLNVGDVITLSYTGQYPFEVVADAGVNPPIEKVLEAKDVSEKAAAVTMAAALLAESNQTARTFTIHTLKAGLAAGQVISIDSTKRASNGINALITNLEITLNTDQFWEYIATAIAGIYQGGPLDYFRQLGGASPSISGSVTTYTEGTNPAVVAGVTAFLGGNGNWNVTPNPAAYARVFGWAPYIATRSFPARVRANLWARVAGISVTPRLWDVTAGAAAATGNAVTTTDPKSAAAKTSFDVSITAGHEYVLELLGSAAGREIAGVAYLESL